MKLEKRCPGRLLSPSEQLLVLLFQLDLTHPQLVKHRASLSMQVGIDLLGVQRLGLMLGTAA
jgi:hypothetical protein